MLKIGTRGSAGPETERVGGRPDPGAPPGLTVELVVIKTKGDIMQDVALVKIGGKGVFVKEIEESLLRGRWTWPSTA